jgi:hypothetical protein
MIQVAVINQSTVVPNADVQNLAYALNVQQWRDLYPTWGIKSNVVFYPNKVAPASSWQLVILDDSDQAGALGYHQLTANGHPLGKVFARTSQQAGLNWTITASHELLEMMGDPYVNLSAQVSNTQFYAYELCDACEDDSFGYQITLANGKIVSVSDFVNPMYFNPTGSPGPAGFTYDFQGHITAPLTLLVNGYTDVLNLTGGETWTQLTAEKSPSLMHKIEAMKGTHPILRRLSRSSWKKSLR